MSAYINRDSIAGIFFTVFSLFLLFVLIPLQVAPSEGGPVALSPRLFCYITGTLLLLLSISLCWSSITEQRKNNDDLPQELINPEQLRRGFISVVISSVYILLLGVLGYFVSTSLTMMFFLWSFGVRKWLACLVFLLILLPFIYALFVLALKVMLPTGIMI